MKKALNLGCGPVYFESNADIEWENSDLADTESSRSWKVDKKRDFAQPFDDLFDNSVDIIVAWHIIEHVGLHENGSIVREWARVLKPGGRLYIACPNVREIARRIVNGTPPWNDPYICMVNLYGPYNGFEGDYHKWGFFPESLCKLLTDNGFSDAREMNMSPFGELGFADYNIQIEGIK